MPLPDIQNQAECRGMGIWLWCCKDVVLRCEIHRFDPGKRTCRCGKRKVGEPIVKSQGWHQFQRKRKEPEQPTLDDLDAEELPIAPDDE